MIPLAAPLSQWAPPPAASGRPAAGRPGPALGGEGGGPPRSSVLSAGVAGGERPGHRVAVPVVPAADQERRDREPAVIRPQRGTPPVGPVLLPGQPGHQPRLTVEPAGEGR